MLGPTEGKETSLKQGKDQNDDGQDDGSGAAIPIILIIQCNIVEIDQWRARQNLVATGHDVEELIEGLESRNHVQQEHRDRRVAQQWEGNVAEGLPATFRAINQRGFEEFARNFLQSGDKDDHINAELEPEANRN